MSSDEFHSLSEVWSARYDDRDDDELACHIWAQRLALRDQAIANPIKPFSMGPDGAPPPELPEAANDSKAK